MKPTIYVPAAAMAILAACSSLDSPSQSQAPPPAFDTFTAQGDSTTVAGILEQFRTALGGGLNAPNAPPAASGRREINWDGVPAALTNVDDFPADFFNATSRRGAVFITPGAGFRIDSTAFAALEAGLGDQFKPFSAKKLFAAVGTKHVGVDFRLVGTATAGVVNGFGVVFSDVDRAGSTMVEFLDAAGLRLALLQAPAHPGVHEFTFVGAVFRSPVVAGVRITSGDGPVSANSADLSAGGSADLVVMDDLVYGEPQPIPE